MENAFFEDFLGDQECLIFDEEDKPLYDACGDEITVYRGCRQDEIDGFEGDGEGLGISWTTRKGNGAMVRKSL